MVPYVFHISLGLPRSKSQDGIKYPRISLGERTGRKNREGGRQDSLGEPAAQIWLLKQESGKEDLLKASETHGKSKASLARLSQEEVATVSFPHSVTCPEQWWRNLRDCSTRGPWWIILPAGEDVWGTSAQQLYILFIFPCCLFSRYILYTSNAQAPSWAQES